MIIPPAPPARGQVKTGEEYRTLMKKTAARVEKWPQWKLGEKSTRICFPPEPIDWTPRDGGPPWIQALASWTLDERLRKHQPFEYTP